MTFAISGVNIVTPFRVIERGCILVEGKTIAGVGTPKEVQIPRGTKTHDFHDMMLTPGYVDLLVHGGAGHGFADMSREAAESISHFFFKHGTTGMLAALHSKPEKALLADVRQIAEFCASSKLSNVWGMHLEGPFINKKLHGAMKVEYLWQPSVEGWKKLHEVGKGFIRLMTLAPELPGMEEVMRSAARGGVVLSIGHSAANYAQVLAAIDNGAAHITHLFNAMTAFHHRQPSVAVAAMLHNELKVELIADGLHVHPAVLRLIYRVKGEGGIILITDAIRACGMPDGEYTFMDQRIHVKQKRAYLENGTLAGSTLTMEKAVKNMVELVGVPITDAVRMASLNGAKVLGLEHRKGILAVGKDADLVVLDKDFEVQMTVCEGTIKYDRRKDEAA